jgi:hypothetical protein
MEENQEMSLLSEAMEPCVMMDKISISDGYGGTDKAWTEGAQFEAAISFNSSVNALTAQAQGVTSLYTVTTQRSVKLDFHEIFRRVRDGKIFRVTSDGDDQYTPKSAGLDMRCVTAEEWHLD